MGVCHETRPEFPLRLGWPPERRRARGFSYIGLLILVAVMGISLAAAGEIWYTALKREKEQELLFVGGQFRRAIERFYENTPPGHARRYPLHLEELLLDPRHPETRRYLRKIYLDPMTGGAEWGLVTGPGGEVLGVYSLSEDKPLKQAKFRLADKDFEDKTKYTEWVFMPLLR